MPIEMQCPRCGSPQTYPDVSRSSAARCLTCGTQFRIGNPTAPSGGVVVCQALDQPSNTGIRARPDVIVTAQVVPPPAGQPPAVGSPARMGGSQQASPVPWAHATVPVQRGGPAGEDFGPWAPRRRRRAPAEGGLQPLYLVLGIGGACAALLVAVVLARGIWFLVQPSRLNDSPTPAGETDVVAPVGPPNNAPAPWPGALGPVAPPVINVPPPVPPAPLPAPPPGPRLPPGGLGPRPAGPVLPPAPRGPMRPGRIRPGLPRR